MPMLPANPFQASLFFNFWNSLTNQVKSDIKGFFGNKVYKTVIPRNVRVSEAPSFGKPVLIYDSKCKGSKAYLGLAKEFLKQEKQKAVNQ